MISAMMITNYTSFIHNSNERKDYYEMEILHRDKFQESRQTIPKDDTRRRIPSNYYTPRHYNHVRN